jgi:hypothetical protein
MLVLALALMIAACAAPDRARAPDADVWGEFETRRYGEIGEFDDPRVFHVAPPEGGARDIEMERFIRQSLERRGFAVADNTSANAPHMLRYLMQTALTDADDDGLGILLGGTIGSRSGVNDFGIGLDLPFLRGGSSVRQVSFLFELFLEGPDGALLWRGRALGRTRFSNHGRIARPLAPLLLDLLGRNSPARQFAR